MFSQTSDEQAAAAKPATGEISKTQPEIGRVLPTFDELPSFHDFKGCAWEVWGKDDELGTINLLTPEVVARAAKEEIWCVYY
jgi:hypothetical protein